LSRRVIYKGPYDNDRPRHVELRTQDEYDRGVPNTLWHTMKKHATYDLGAIRYVGKGLKGNARWVGNLHKGQGEKRRRVHFTVSYGSGKPIDPYIPKEDDDQYIRESRAEQEVAIRVEREEEKDFPLNKCLEILREGYAIQHHYGPSRQGVRRS